MDLCIVDKQIVKIANLHSYQVKSNRFVFTGQGDKNNSWILKFKSNQTNIGLQSTSAKTLIEFSSVFWWTWLLLIVLFLVRMWHNHLGCIGWRFSSPFIDGKFPFFDLDITLCIITCYNQPGRPKIVCYTQCICLVSLGEFLSPEQTLVLGSDISCKLVVASSSECASHDARWPPHYNTIPVDLPIIL